ncbi:hypothetical protein U0070_022893 [Myodes glareolus]|uniref:Uncharacterized protein n=1 Tax=Myodes glareolus TaxID=447135 RepID=A0AAW0H4Z1_MYOGA
MAKSPVCAACFKSDQFCEKEKRHRKDCLKISGGWPALSLVISAKKRKALKRVSQDLWRLVRIVGSRGPRPALSLVSSARKKTVIEETVSDLWRLITYSGCLVILRLLLTSAVNRSAPT